MESKGRASRRSTGGQSPVKSADKKTVTPVKSADKKTVTPVSVTRRSTRLMGKVEGDTITTPASSYVKKASATRKRSLKTSDEDNE